MKSPINHHNNTNKSSYKRLNFIIVGCGKVGCSLLHELNKEGHYITIIDKNAAKVQSLVNMYDIMGVTGNGASYSVQMEAGISDADLFIAVTNSDELNLLCCTVASRTAKCSAIARVRTPDYSEEANYLKDRLNLAMIINPELEAAREVARILYLPTSLEVNTFAHGEAEIVKFKVPSDSMLNGMKISDLNKHVPTQFVISAVERDGEVILPTGEFIFAEDDLVSFVATRQGARNFLKKTGFKTNQVKDTLIIGGGTFGYYLAKNLINYGISVKIIESDMERCEELSILLPKAVIINGDGTDEELLKEEGIEYVESFVPLTGIDEENIMLTLYANNVSDTKVVTKINRINFKDVISNLDLGSVVYPKHITAEAIVAYVRGKSNSTGNTIETLYHLFDSTVEAIEFKVDGASDVTNIPIMNLDIKNDLLICFINRNGTIIIPNGKDVIKAGDSVMIVTKHSGFNCLNDILNT